MILNGCTYREVRYDMAHANASLDIFSIFKSSLCLSRPTTSSHQKSVFFKFSSSFWMDGFQRSEYPLIRHFTWSAASVSDFIHQHAESSHMGVKGTGLLYGVGKLNVIPEVSERASGKMSPHPRLGLREVGNGSVRRGSTSRPAKAPSSIAINCKPCITADGS